MSVGLWILIVILLLLLVLLLLPVGVDAEYVPEGFFLRLKAGPIRITVLPRKPKAEKKPKKPKKEKPKKEKKPKKKLKLTLSLIFELLRLALEAVGSFRRKLRVELFRLYLLIASKDPYQTATLYGKVCAALEGLYPFAARAVTIDERDVRVQADFTEEKLQAQGRIVLTIRIGQIFAIGLVFVWKLLVWYLKEKSEHRKAARQAAERTE